MIVNSQECWMCCSVDIEWPEGDEALSERAQSTIDALLSNDPRARPDAAGQHDLLNYSPFYRNI